MKRLKREISVNYSKTINTGNFSSQKIDIGLTRGLSDSEDIEDEIIREFKFVKKCVNKQVKKIIKGMEG